MTTSAAHTAPTTWTILSLLEWTSGHLATKGFNEARLTVELLLAHVLNVRRLDLYLQFDRPLAPNELSAFKALYERRLTHEPLQYILGETEFMGLRLAVDPTVLIPRPETELLVEHALHAARSLGRSDLHILDVGTGSGNVAIAIAAGLGKGARVVTIDVNSQALELAERNAGTNNVSSVRFVNGDIFDDILPGEAFDMIVSNPPYVPAEEYRSLEPEVRSYEPENAVSDGGDGLRFYRRLAEFAPARLRPGGILAVEIGHDQADAVVTTFCASGLEEVTVHNDYAGIGRIVLARNKGQVEGAQ